VSFETDMVRKASCDIEIKEPLRTVNMTSRLRISRPFDLTAGWEACCLSNTCGGMRRYASVVSERTRRRCSKRTMACRRSNVRMPVTTLMEQTKA
jgi:hypothetical protein